MSKSPPGLVVDGHPVDQVSDTQSTELQWPEHPDVKHRILPIRPLGDHVPANPYISPREVPEDRGLHADPNLSNLLTSGIERLDLTPSIGYVHSSLGMEQMLMKSFKDTAIRNPAESIDRCAKS